MPNYVFDQKFRRVVDFLSLEPEQLEEPHVPEKIMFLYDWAERKAGSENMNVVLSKLKSFKNDIGATLRGRPLMLDMYKFAKLDAQKILAKDKREYEAKTEDEKKAIEKEQQEKLELRRKTLATTKDELKREAKQKDQDNLDRLDTVKRAMESFKVKEFHKIDERVAANSVVPTPYTPNWGVGKTN